MALANQAEHLVQKRYHVTFGLVARVLGVERSAPWTHGSLRWWDEPCTYGTLGPGVGPYSLYMKAPEPFMEGAMNLFMRWIDQTKRPELEWAERIENHRASSR